jgi:membrane associated rhomboid family serine protease
MAASSTKPRSDFAAGVQVLLAMVGVMWALEIVDVALDHRLDDYGIEPRDVDALPGVVSSPFLHAGFGHLIGNTIPFVAMGLAIALAGAKRLVVVTLIVGLIAGLGTWLTASANTETIGASGLVFGYATYLMTRFFFSRRMLDLALGLGVLVLWGASLLSSLAPTPGVSWQAHLFGAVGGVVAARVVGAGQSAPQRAP